MQALPPGAARPVYAYPQHASFGTCELLYGVFGEALQGRRRGDFWVLRARSTSRACTVLAVHDVYEERRSNQYRDLAAYLAEYPRERVFRCVHQRDLARVLQCGVLEGLAQEDICVTSDVWLALEGASAYGPGWNLLVFELAVGREAVGQYELPPAFPCGADVHVCTLVNAERTVFRALYPDQLLLQMVVEIEVYACKDAPPEYGETPVLNPGLHMQRARQRALAAAVVGSADYGPSPVPQSTSDACSEADIEAAPARLSRPTTRGALAVDFCTDGSCALLQATDARLCAADIFCDTSTSPITAEAARGSPDTVDVYACDFEPHFFAFCTADTRNTGTHAVAGKISCSGLHTADARQPQVCEADARKPQVCEADARERSDARPGARMCPKKSGARTRAQSPNRVCCSKLPYGAVVVMRNMLRPFEFCEGKLGQVWHVEHGKRPKFWVIALDKAVGVKIAEINSGRSAYYAPHFILMLQRFQLERCSDVAHAQAKA